MRIAFAILALVACVILFIWFCYQIAEVLTQSSVEQGGTQEGQDEQASATTRAVQSRFGVLDGTNGSGPRAQSWVIVDSDTGVQYLWVYRGDVYGSAGGLTVLVDSDGKPLLATQADREGEQR